MMTFVRERERQRMNNYSKTGERAAVSFEELDSEA